VSSVDSAPLPLPLPPGYRNPLRSVKDDCPVVPIALSWRTPGVRTGAQLHQAKPAAAPSLSYHVSLGFAAHSIPSSASLAKVGQP